MRALRTALAAALLAAALAGCGIAPTASPEVAVPDDPVTSAPPTGGTDIQPDEPTGDPAVSVSLPSLPVGGSGEFVDDRQDLQCAEVSWIVDEEGPAALRDGIRIDITAVRVDERVFALADDGCADRGESCVGYTFTAESASPACVLPVRTRRPLTVEVADTSLTVAGTVRCADVPAWECEAFVAAARGGVGSVQLSPPAPDETDGEIDGEIDGETDGEADGEADGSPSPSVSQPAVEPSETAGG